MSRSRLLLTVLLVVLTVAVYGRACTFDFVAQDDGRYVVKNVHVLGGLNLRDVKWAATTRYDGNWFPLTWISLMADASLYGSEAGGFHLTNVLLHVLNVVLVFSFFAAATGAAGRSACVAALFAVHPLHVESVAFISERKDVLSLFCGLLAMHAYLSYSRSGRLSWYLAAIGLFLLSLFAKQTLVTLPCVLLLLDFWPLARLTRQSATRRVVEKIPFILLAVVFSIVAYKAQSAGGAIMSLRHLPLSQRLFNAVVAYGLYLQKFVFPVNLAFFYPHPRMLSLADVALPALLLFGISAAALTTLRRLPFLFVGWCWFLGTLIPLIGLVQIGRQQIADRYMYFPAIGLYVAVVWTVQALLARFALARTSPVVAAAVVGVLAVLGSRQAVTWRNNDALFLHALKVAPDNPVTRGLYGQALIEEGRVAEGLDQCQRAVELAPDDSLAHYRLASALLGADRVPDALRELTASLRLDEQNPAAHYLVADIFLSQHKYAEAELQFRRAAALDPHAAPAYVGLGEVSLARREYPAAVSWNKRALLEDDTLFAARAGIARALCAQGRVAEAMVCLERGQAQFPLERQAYAELMAALSTTNQPATNQPPTHQP